MDGPTGTRAALDAWLAAVNAHDLDAYAKAVTEDYTWTLGANATSGRDVSRESWRLLFEAFPDYRLDLLESVEDGSRIAWRARMTGTHQGPLRFRGTASMDAPWAASGRRFELECAGFTGVHDGRVSLNRAYWQPSDMLAQLGFGPPRP